MHSYRRNTGFSILELMIVVAIVGIMVVIGVPSMQSFIKNSCLSTGTSNLVVSLSLARSESIKRRATVSLFASNAAGNNEWGSGWAVFLDADNDGTLDAGETTLRAITLDCTQTTIDETGNRTSFRFTSGGTVDQSGQFDICDDRAGETGRQINLSNSGRASNNSKYGGCA
ncbi:MAG: hypothetical protein BMS9Abin15_0384 [Gammaproteobacteria bacterium]|nr:MAG: hypothetical protein BMS9Abin15_0384 [Gammaproteobacteria bacterium]